MPFESGGQSPPGVFFDEGDFEDDGDLDFNDSMADFASSTITSFAVPAVPANRNPSTSRQRPGAEGAELQHSGFPSSSAPFDWSSSPAEHFLRPPGPSSVRQPATIGEDAGEEDAMEEIPRSKKRQVHPWENKDGSDENPLPTRKSTTSRVERKRLTSAYPWDMTASDLKRRKSEQKRSYSTAPSAQPAPAPKAMKQKPLTLSPEQNHVLDIVRNAKKSVFFTGSAGQSSLKSAFDVSDYSFTLGRSYEIEGVLVLTFNVQVRVNQFCCERLFVSSVGRGLKRKLSLSLHLPGLRHATLAASPSTVLLGLVWGKGRLKNWSKRSREIPKQRTAGIEQKFLSLTRYQWWMLNCSTSSKKSLEY